MGAESVWFRYCFSLSRYLPLPGLRNAYRSVKAHFAPHLREKEPGDLSIGTFVIGGDSQAIALYFGVLGFLRRHVGYGSPVYRHITIEDMAVVVTDFSPVVELHQTAYAKLPFSSAYGILQSNVVNNYEVIN